MQLSLINKTTQHLASDLLIQQTRISLLILKTELTNLKKNLIPYNNFHSELYVIFILLTSLFISVSD
jgi:hypothetical protein